MTAPKQRTSPGRLDDSRPGDVLSLADLTWRVGGRTIVDAVCLDVSPGELLAVIGPNGAGKTSLFNLITGFIRPTGGRIVVNGQDVTRMPPHRRVPHGLGRTFQTSSVFASMSVRENVEIAAQAAIGGPWKSLAPWARITAGARTRGRDALDRTRLGDRADLPAGALSHGEKRKLELAIVLAGAAQVVLLDEPMAGMAMEEVPELTDLIGAIHRGGATVLMVEHHMDVVLDIAERIAVLHHGELIAHGSAADVAADPVVREAYMGVTL
ncbi:MAG TPA: ABC transporter ATP-binding protein [Micromonosporaceae bacterium]